MLFCYIMVQFSVGFLLLQILGFFQYLAVFLHCILLVAILSVFSVLGFCSFGNVSFLWQFLQCLVAFLSIFQYWVFATFDVYPSCDNSYKLWSPFCNMVSNLFDIIILFVYGRMFF